MKRLVALLLACVMLFALVACGQSGNQPTPPAGGNNTPAGGNNTPAGGNNTPAGGNESPVVQLPKSITIGSGSMGSTNNTIAVAVASVVTNNTEIELKAIATSGSTEYVPMMDTEEIDLGVIANYDGLMAYTGAGSFEKLNGGEGYDFSILVCGSPQFVLNLVAANSGINSGADFAGKRYALEYTGNDSVTAMAKALLANHGLTADDVTPIAIESIPNAINAIIEGRLDICQSALAVATLYELDAAKGVKFIGLDDSPEAMERMKEFYPGYAKLLTPEDSPWITEPINALAYDNYVIARDTLSEDVAYLVTKALYEYNQELLAASNATQDWVIENYVNTNVAVPYHPGAIKFYQEIGIWTTEMQAHQDALIASLR